jgi:thioredoxin-like negative regulator of GroEL
MQIIGILAVIVLCIGGIVWRRRLRWHAYTTPVVPGTIPRETLALRAFAHGNSCLAEGKFAEAIDAFEQAREIEPKHPHVAGRLAEVARQQQAVSAAPSVNTTV